MSRDTFLGIRDRRKNLETRHFEFEISEISSPKKRGKKRTMPALAHDVVSFVLTELSVSFSFAITLPAALPRACYDLLVFRPILVGVHRGLISEQSVSTPVEFFFTQEKF